MTEHDGLTAEQEADATLSPLRMEAYYYRFERTGVPEIDKILSAVACAGKSAHHTRDWGGQDDSGQDNERPPFRGTSSIQWIQNAANDAAETKWATEREKARASAAAEARVAELERALSALVDKILGPDEGAEAWDELIDLADAGMRALTPPTTEAVTEVEGS